MFNWCRPVPVSIRGVSRNKNCFSAGVVRIQCQPDLIFPTGVVRSRARKVPSPWRFPNRCRLVVWLLRGGVSVVARNSRKSTEQVFVEPSLPSTVPRTEGISTVLPRVAVDITFSGSKW